MTEHQIFKVAAEYATSQHPTHRVEMNLTQHHDFKEDTWVSMTVKGRLVGYGLIKNNPKCDAFQIQIEDYMLSRILSSNMKRASEQRKIGLDLVVEIEALLPITATLGIRKQMGLSEKSELVLGKALYKSLVESCPYKKDAVVRLFNPATGATADYTLNECAEGNVDDHDYVINFYERELMLLREPRFIKTAFYQAMPDTAKETLGHYYENEGEKSAYWTLKISEQAVPWDTIRKQLRVAGYYQAQMYCLNLPKRSWMRAVGSCLLSLYNRGLKAVIGEKILKFRVVRPLPIDENSLAGRLSETSFQMLGVEDGEKIVVSYYGKSISLRVHSFAGLESMKKVNLVFDEDELNYAIGIPSAVRRELGIYDLNTVVSVKRDSSYIFWKKSHMQILPLIGLLISIISITSNLQIRIALLTCLSIFSVYLMLSEERSKVK